MAAARPSQAAVERAIRAAAKHGLRPRAMDLLPGGGVRLLFDEPEPVPSSPAGGEEGHNSCDEAFGS